VQQQNELFHGKFLSLFQRTTHWLKERRARRGIIDISPKYFCPNQEAGAFSMSILTGDNMVRWIFLALALFAVPSAAHDFEKNDIHVGDAWARTPIGIGKTTAGYLSISSFSDQPDRLVGARSTAAARVELHTHIKDGGVMRMRRLEGLDINPMGGGELALGGHHLMIMGLKQKIRSGDRLPVTLIFEKAGEMEIVLEVKKGP
jgi:copper(I)-binding protein